VRVGVKRQRFAAAGPGAPAELRDVEDARLVEGGVVVEDIFASLEGDHVEAFAGCAVGLSQPAHVGSSEM
jgi:hypothetical protein